MQRLFERIADHHAGTVEAEEVRENYARLLVHDPTQDEGGGYYVSGTPRRPTRVEIFAYECKSLEGASVPLVRVGYPDDGEPVLVSPVPSAILAVALR